MMNRNISDVRRGRGAFTLIELLIVVAIIAFLAAIAVPNFLEAQVRAKVSRMRNDMRTLATAVETYFVDANAYPPHRTESGDEIAYPNRFFPLTTPVAYLTVPPPPDVFAIDPIGGQGGSGIYISWTNLASFPATHALAPVVETQRYLIRSRGPDAENESNEVRNAFLVLGIGAAPSMLYDPTNGTISRGDLIRTARFTE
jgi:prepilin-type N-terminal cleavage/methylation domain-containing protein